MPIQQLPEGRYLPEQQGHRVWWCETGLPEGAPLLVLHGGPGGRTRIAPFAWFDGLPLRCIAFDQRGCGQSLPAGRLEHNTLNDLVADIERLRVALGITAWGIVAGSWGAVLALAYAAEHPQRVTGLFLRSAFLGSDEEVARFFEPWPAWLGGSGAAWLGADAPDNPLMLLRAAAQAEPARRTPSRARIAIAWQAFEQAQARAGGLRVAPRARFVPPEGGADASAESADALPTSLAVQLHYLQQHCFVQPGQAEDWIDAVGATLAERPVALVHGLADEVCAPQTSAKLSARWPHATVRWVEAAGHDMDAVALHQALTESARAWATRMIRATP